MRVFAFLLLFLSLCTQAQTTVSGVVKDSKNNEPLPFATITTQNNKTVIGDLDGKFIIEQAPIAFTISYLGYKPQTIYVQTGIRFYTVKLEPTTTLLKEVILSNENPADNIIRRAIQMKPGNDPQQHLTSFTYKTYEKLVVTANPDSISGKLDSIFAYEKLGRRFQKVDSTGFKFKKIVGKQHLYQTEKVSEFKFNRPQGLKENVLATRMAGFKQPLYEYIGLKLQSYSVYTNSIDLIESKYAGPLADDAFTEYHYQILDTVNIDNRSVYMIYFSPKHNKKNKLKGILYIDRNTYGVAKAIFRVKQVLDVTSTHYFTFEKEQGLWFPDRKTLKVSKGNSKEDIKILGETITFDGVEKNKNGRRKEPSDFVYVYSEARNFEKQFNIPLNIQRASVAIEIKDEAVNRPEEYWNTFRTDTLDSRSMQTYTTLDSIVAKENWEQRILFGRRIFNGYIPVGPVDIDIKQVVKYNNYEGFRLGMGGITNNKFSKIFRMSGYGAYGTKDGKFKYGGGAAIRLGNFSNSWIGASYADDIREIASTTFATDKRVFKIYDPRPINTSTFYNYKAWQGYIETKILPKSESVWQLTHSSIDPLFDYTFNPNGKAYSQFHLTTASVSIQWNPFSDFMQTPQGKLEIEKRFPKFAFQYTQSLANFLDSDFTFSKFDFRVEFERKFLNGQKTAALIQTGIAVGDAPLTHLYSTSPNNLDKDGMFARITFAGKNSFETMYYNEFFSSRYAMLQIKHGLNRFTIFRKIKLSPMIVTRVAWGNMDHKEEHQGIEFNTLEKGYYESGVELNEIIYGFGISAFYRYGPYHIEEFDRNVSLKISYVFNLF